MTTTPFRYTTEQQELLANNAHFIPVAILDDGDVLIFQGAGPMGGPYEGGYIAKYLAYVLTRDGKIQGVSYHYENCHDVGARLDSPVALEREPSPALDTSLLITLDSARVYLADVCNVELTTRTLRNYCASGRLDCVRLSDTSKSPWYTKAIAVHKLAEELTGVVDDAPLPSDNRASDPLAKINRIRELAFNIASNLGEGTAEELVGFALSPEGRESWGIDIELDAEDRNLLVRFVAASLDPDEEAEEPAGVVDGAPLPSDDLRWEKVDG